MHVEYTPPESLIEFLQSEKFVSLVVGPVGSTKTTAGIMKICYHAKRMAPCIDGKRRSRAIWVRNTREQLRDTSIPDFLKWFPNGVAGEYFKSEYKYMLRFDDVECEILFRGLDDADDVRKVLSLQASFAILDEFREIDKDVFEALQGRLGRYPDKQLVPPRPEWGIDKEGNPIGGCVTDEGKYNKHLWGMSNPPDADTFWENILSEPPDNTFVKIQPSGRSPDADWRKYLDADYYDNLAEGKSEDWISVYIDAKFGKSLSGQPVYRAFNQDIHVSKGPLTPIRSGTYPLIIGLDFGLTPAATLNQVDPSGRFLTFDALVSNGMGILRFSREKLKPLLHAKFSGMTVLIVGDPAGTQRAQTDERTVYDILKAEGFKAIPAKTNSIIARVNAVEGWLTRMVDGKPARFIDPGCQELIRAYRGAYRYKTKKNGEKEDTPEKNAASHVADSDQYASMHADNNFTGRILQRPAQVIQKRSYVWT